MPIDPSVGKSQRLPKPASNVRGENTREPAGDSFEDVAKLYKPANVGTELPKATVSRYALALINQTTGEAVSAEEVAGTVDNAAVNAAIATDTAASRLALELNGVVVSKADGTRKGYAPSANTDTARGLALEQAFLNAVAGDTIDLSPGSYYVGKATSTIGGYTAQYAILNKMTIRLNGAYLWKQNTDTASAMFATSGTSGTDDWSIIGPGTIEGSYIDTANTTGARGSSANEIGITLNACRRWRIENIRIKNFAGTGLQLNNATFAADDYSGQKISTGSIIACSIDLNNLGLTTYAGNEFSEFTNCTFNKNQTGCDIYAGNTRFNGCHASANVNFALRIRNGGNDGHGCWNGGAFAHNTGFAIAAEASMDLGFLFVGVTFGADSVTTNKIQSLGAGITLVGCYVESPFFASATPTGLNTMANCFIPGTYTVTTDLSAAERLQWIMLDNYTPTGTWANNDDRIYVYADDAAAATGGLVAGRRYSTSTGELRIKL